MKKYIWSKLIEAATKKQRAESKEWNMECINTNGKQVGFNLDLVVALHQGVNLNFFVPVLQVSATNLKCSAEIIKLLFFFY